MNESQAATSIQKIVKGFLARKHFLKIHTHIIKIQAWVRGFLVRVNLKRMKNSATKIQTHYRTYRETKKERSQFVNIKKATICIQQEWRRFKFRNGIE